MLGTPVSLGSLVVSILYRPDLQMCHGIRLPIINEGDRVIERQRPVAGPDSQRKDEYNYLKGHQSGN
jgi:hypothetical protein